MTLIVDQAPSAHRGMNPRDGGSTVPAHLRAAGVRLAAIPPAALIAMALASPAVAGHEGEEPEGLSSGDWASIRTAYEAGRHRAFAVDGGHRARNPGQQWTTCFDGRGFTTTPDGGGWSWGLELVRYGWGTDQREVALPESVSAEGGRVAYTWDERL